ncbi:YdcF family protein, partial [Candidatus Omnitrophota bacterium]
GSSDLAVARGAAELYKSGKTKFKYVMTSGKGQGDLAEAELFKREMIKHGVPEEAFLEPETESRFMGENLSFSAKKLAESGKLSEINSVAVVQTPLYNRQAKAAFGKNFVAEEGKTATQEAYVYAPYLPAKIDRTKSTLEMKRQQEEVLEAIDKLDDFAEKGWIDKVDMPEEVKEAVKKLKEISPTQIEADSVIANIITLAREAGRQNQQLIIGLETDWIPGYKEGGPRHDAINPLISMIESLGDELRKMGLTNVILVPGTGDALAASLLDKAKETSTHLSNVVVMASKDTISSDKFDSLRSTQHKKGAFLASIDPSEIIEAYEKNKVKETRYHVIKMMMILSLTLELAAGKSAPILPKKFPVKMTYDEKLRTVMYKLKPMEPIEYGLMVEEHKNELKALRAL